MEKFLLFFKGDKVPATDRSLLKEDPQIQILEDSGKVFLIETEEKYLENFLRSTQNWTFSKLKQIRPAKVAAY